MNVAAPLPPPHPRRSAVAPNVDWEVDDDPVIAALPELVRLLGVGSALSLVDAAAVPGAMPLEPVLDALQTAGWTPEFVEASLPRLAAQGLPSVLLLEGGAACVLAGRRQDGAGRWNCEVLLPAQPGERARRLDVAQADLAAAYLGLALTVRPTARRSDAAPSRASAPPDLRARAATPAQPAVAAPTWPSREPQALPRDDAAVPRSQPPTPIPTLAPRAPHASLRPLPAWQAAGHASLALLATLAGLGTGHAPSALGLAAQNSWAWAPSRPRWLVRRTRPSAADTRTEPVMAPMDEAPPAAQTTRLRSLAPRPALRRGSAIGGWRSPLPPAPVGPPAPVALGDAAVPFERPAGRVAARPFEHSAARLPAARSFEPLARTAAPSGPTLGTKAGPDAAQSVATRPAQGQEPSPQADSASADPGRATPGA